MVALAHRARRRSPISVPPGVGVLAMRSWAHRTPLAEVGLLFALAAGGGGRGAARAEPARRIVSLSPAVTELLFAIGAGDRVVGRTTWCDYPPAARTVPSVGDGLNPNLEAVAARRPDLVLLSPSASNATAARQLERLGLRAVLLPQDRLEDVARAARRLGALTGRQAAGDSLAGALERWLAAPPPPARVRLAFVAWDNPPVVIGGGSYLDQLAALAGGRNVFHDLAAPSATVSLETIAARAPDVIVELADSAAARPPPYAARREWQAIRAVRERRFVYLVGSLFGRSSPRAPEAAARFHELLEAAR